MQKEISLEKKLVSICKSKGIHCWKMSSSSINGIPDRLLVKDTKQVWVELKTDKGLVSNNQKEVHKILGNVYLVRNVVEIIELIEKEFIIKLCA